MCQYLGYGTAVTSRQCHMPDIGTSAPFELIWYHAIKHTMISKDIGIVCNDMQKVRVTSRLVIALVLRFAVINRDQLLY